MAEEPERFETAALKSLYKRMSDHHLARGNSVVQRLTGVHENKLSAIPEDSMAELLGRQAGGLTKADEILGGISGENRFSSRGEHAAAVERGIQDKMRAMGMLDEAMGNTPGATPMMADYVDPVTGEVVNADTFDSSSALAVDRANRQAFEDAGAGIEDPFGYLSRDLNQDTFWEDAFGAETGAQMRASADAGIIDPYEVFGGLKNFQNKMTNQVRDMSLQAITDERTLRAEAARAQAESFQNQEAQAQLKSDALAAEAAKGKQAIQKSIEEDKQNLARQSHGSIGGGQKKTRIDYGGGSSRPV